MMVRFILGFRDKCQLVSVAAFSVSSRQGSSGVTWCRHVYVRRMATTSGIDSGTYPNVADSKDRLPSNAPKQSTNMATNSETGTVHPVTRHRNNIIKRVPKSVPVTNHRGSRVQSPTSFRKFADNDNYPRKSDTGKYSKFEGMKSGQNNYFRNSQNNDFDKRVNKFSNRQFNGVKGGHRVRDEPRLMVGDQSKTHRHSDLDNTRDDVQATPDVRQVVRTDRSTSDSHQSTPYNWDELPEKDKFGTHGENESNKPTYRTGKTEPRQQSAPGSGSPARWSDMFGTQVPEAHMRTAETKFDDNESDDDEHHIRLSRTNRRHVPDWYGRRIMKMGKQGQIKEALEMLEDKMIKEDRVKPRPFEFRAAISSLGHVGYTKKAFKLFNRMIKMGIRPDYHTYTGLFNACANSPFKEDGLRYAEKLYNTMKEKGFEPQFITYQTMIKAFGMCGDIDTAFSLADECAQQFGVSRNLFSTLLVVCVSDREAGLRHAIMVWRKMTGQKLRPRTVDYNMLLRTINTCGVGDEQLFNTELLGSADGCTNYIGRKASSRRKIVSPWTTAPTLISDDSVVNTKETKVFMQTSKTCEEGTVSVNEMDLSEAGSVVETGSPEAQDSVQLVRISDHGPGEFMQNDRDNNIRRSDTTALVNSPAKWTWSEYKANAPVNLLKPSVNMSNIVSVAQIKTASDKLWLVGGMEQIMEQMKLDGAKPNLATFIMLILAVPAEQEHKVLDMMAEYNVAPDIDMFNHLIRKLASSKRNDDAWVARKLIKKYGLEPNMKTFGCLATLCKKPVHGFRLLEEMKAMDMEPNAVIMQTLIWQSYMNFRYKAKLLVAMDTIDLPVTEQLITTIESTITQAKDLLLKAEKGLQLTNTEIYKLKTLDQDALEEFVVFYTDWLKTKTLKKLEHPWKEFMPDKKAEPIAKKR